MTSYARSAEIADHVQYVIENPAGLSVGALEAAQSSEATERVALTLLNRCPWGEESGRKCIPYSTNISCSHSETLDRLARGELSAQQMSDHMLKERWRPAPVDESVFTRCRDHAYRRMQLFYYLCVAYYQTQCTARRINTVYQHGTGMTQGTSAAHSGILPNVADDFFECLVKEVEADGLSERHARILAAYGVDAETLRGVSQGNVEALFAAVPESERSLLTESCHFYQNMNSTVELPSPVNMYDMAIERHMRHRAVNILNQVSQGKLSPYQGLQEFRRQIQRFFAKSAAEIRLNQMRLDRIYELELGLKEGDVADTLRKLVELQELRQAVEEQTTYSPVPRLNYRYKTRGALLEEVYKRCGSEYCTVAALEDPQQIKAYIAGMIERAEACSPTEARKSRMLQRYTRLRSVDSLRELVREYCEQYDRVAIARSQEGEEPFADIVKKARSWRISPFGWVRENVDNDLAYCDAQRCGSRMPPQESLSGHIVNGRRVKASEAELLEEQLHIIRRTYHVSFA